MIISETDKQRFWSKVEKTDTCWFWRGLKDVHGYGQFSYKANRYSAHRFAYCITKGVIASNLVVRHTCDNKLCVNPEHLILGTNKQNVQDMKDRRWRYNQKISQIDKEKIRQLREDGKSYKELANLFEVHTSTIWHILSNN